VGPLPIMHANQPVQEGITITKPKQGCPNKDQVGWILADQLWEEDT